MLLYFESEMPHNLLVGMCECECVCVLCVCAHTSVCAYKYAWPYGCLRSMLLLSLSTLYFETVSPTEYGAHCLGAARATCKQQVHAAASVLVECWGSELRSSRVHSNLLIGRAVLPATEVLF